MDYQNNRWFGGVMPSPGRYHDDRAPDIGDRLSADKYCIIYTQQVGLDCDSGFHNRGSPRNVNSDLDTII